MEEEWSLDMFDNLEKEILSDKFVLNNISYTHFFYYDPDSFGGSILSTSIRVYPYNGKWIRRIVTNYIDSNYEEKEISYEREVDESLIRNIESNTDLRKLSNSYSIDQNDYERFEPIYNSIYKIIGDPIFSIEDIDYVRRILTVDEVLKDERKKVSELL